MNPLFALVKSETARVQRATTFVHARVEAMLERLVGAPPGEALDHVLARLEALEATARKAEALIGRAQLSEPAEALDLLRSCEYNGMIAALRGLEQQVERLAAPPAQPAAPQPTDGLTDRLRRYFAPPPRAVPLAAPPSQDRLAVEALEAALRFMATILAYVDPRIAPVRCALDVGEAAPGAPAVVQLALGRKQAEAEVDERMRAWVPHLIRLFLERPPTRRPARIATTQWQQAHELRRQAEALQALAREGKATEALQGLRAGKLRGAVTPLGNLHVTFAGIPHLQALFPPPSPHDDRGC